MTSFDLDLSKYNLGWSDSDVEYAFKPEKGLNEGVIDQISWWKGEPRWMAEMRRRSLRTFNKKPMAEWFAVNMPDIDFQDIYYYLRPANEQVSEWDDLPEQMKATYEKLGIPEAERKYLAGVTAQYECLRGSTKVWTTRGMRTIKELGAGDEVFALNETTKQIEVARVLGGGSSGEKEILEIRAGSRAIGASGNHPFLVLRRGVTTWIPAEHLLVSDLLAIPTDLPVADGLAMCRANVSGEGAVVTLERVLPTSEMLGFVRIESIESVGSEATYDIEVEGHHNFVADGFVVHNSEVVFHRNREDLEKQGILFCDMDTALREYPELVKQYFGTIITPGDNKFSALNTATWSGGSFVYIPAGVNCEMPLQAYFRINSESAGQFERTLIIAEEGSQVHYIEGCSAPVYTKDSLHSAVVEIVVKPSARVTYTTIQNWSPNVYNLVTKRARVEAEGHMEWIDGNIGCLAEGSTVTTPSGIKPIEQVVPGEQVLSFDHASGELVFRQVTAKRFSGVQPVREVSVGARSLTVTDNHPFLSRTDGGEFTYVRADQLKLAVVPTSTIAGSKVLEDREVTVGDHVGEVRTWDIEVEGTGNFLSQGFVVHNSKLTMKYPSVYLVGPKATGEVLSVAYAGAGQHQDAGAKMIHAAPETTSKIVSKSISKDGGITTYRGLVRVDEGAYGCKSHVQCDALILDEDSESRTFPYMEVGERDAEIGHEATVSKIADEQLFYLMSRGLSQEQAMGMVVNGFIEPITKTLPMEYAVEWSRLIELQMEGSVG